MRKNLGKIYIGEIETFVMLSELQAIVGESNATNRETVLLAYSRDASLIDTSKPDYVVRPQTQDQISAIMKLANTTKTPVISAGGRCGMGGGMPASQGGDHAGHDSY